MNPLFVWAIWLFVAWVADWRLMFVLNSAGRRMIKKPGYQRTLAIHLGYLHFLCDRLFWPLFGGAGVCAIGGVLVVVFNGH